MLGWQMLAGAGGGLGGGWLLVRALNRLRLGDSMYPLLALFGGLTIFGVTALVGGSGFLAVYLAGIVLGTVPCAPPPASAVSTTASRGWARSACSSSSVFRSEERLVG